MYPKPIALLYLLPTSVQHAPSFQRIMVVLRIGTAQ